jgi:hypothetical protein
MKTSELISDVLDVVRRENGHNIQVRRDLERGHVPLFRYLARGRCVDCGMEVVIDSSPATIGSNLPFGTSANAWPQASGDAFDFECPGSKRR